MKRLIMIMLLCFGMVSLSSVYAQEQKPTEEEYERYATNKMQMEFRNWVLDAMDLSTEQAERFDPMLREYLNEKSQLAKEKYALVKNYSDRLTAGMSENVSEEETSDFIEDYWELQIQSMEMREEFFDRIEDEIPVKKATGFFLLEDMVENRMEQRVVLYVIPGIIDMEKAPEAFKKWYKERKMEKEKKDPEYDQR